MDLATRINQYLFPYQQDWIQYDGKKAICLKARQIGLTTATALHILLHVLKHDGHTYYIVGTTSKLASEILGIIRTFWIPVFEAGGRQDLVKLVKDNERELSFHNGSRISALANKPENFRGLVGSFLWDEAAFLNESSLRQIANVIFPIIENPLNPECVFRIISTPWGREGLFYEIWTNKNNYYSDFKRFEIDIHKAIKDGYPFDLTNLQKMNPSRRDREYLCQFQEFAGNFFTQSSLLSLNISDKKMSKTLYMGIDLGKKHDKSSLVVMDSNKHFAATYLIGQTDYLEQVEIFSNIINKYEKGGYHIKCIKIDETRNETFTELMKKRFPTKVKGRHFTHKWLKGTIEKLDKDISEEAVSFCFDNVKEWDNGWTDLYRQDLLTSFLMVEQASTPSNQLTYKMDRNEDGHGDSFSAALLAYDAMVDSHEVVFLY